MKETKGTFLYALLQSALVGTLVGALICLFKWSAKYVVACSEKGYGLLREYNWSVLPLVAILAIAAVVLAPIYRHFTTLKGGGIPTAVCAAKGLISFKGLINLIGVFVLSLFSFLCGVPLGTEGPAVQMGAAAGALSTRLFGKKEQSGNLTSGACAGFAAATGAPLSGILFAVEETHKKVSPKIIATAATAVLFSDLTGQVLCPRLGVDVALFKVVDLPVLTTGQLWIPLLCAVVIGVFSVLFLLYYRLIAAVVNKYTQKIPHFVKLFAVLLVTLGAGIYSFYWISTGHEAILTLCRGQFGLWFLGAMVLVRTTLTLSANAVGMTGGIFLPLLTIGATVAATLATLCVRLGMSTQYCVLMVMLGIVGAIAGMMKLPLTALVFAVETLALYDNLPALLIMVTLTYGIVWLSGESSIVELAVSRTEATAPKEETSAASQEQVSVLTR